jgi:Domain of unknown function (DUF4132)
MARRRSRAAAVAREPVLTVTREIDLSPRDWLRATWRKLPPLPRPELVPFNEEQLLVRLRWPGWSWKWWRARISPALSTEEARFWLAVMTHRQEQQSGFQITREEVSGWISEGDWSPEGIRHRLRRQPELVPAEAAPVLANLFPLEELAALILDDVIGSGPGLAPNWKLNERLAVGLCRYVLPHADAAERDRWRAFLRPRVDPACWPTGWHDPPPLAFVIAAEVGMPDEILRLVEGWPDNLRPPSGRLAHTRLLDAVVPGLGSADLFAHHFVRLGLNFKKGPHEFLTSADLVKIWLAHTEFSRLDFVRDQVLRSSSKETAREKLEVFALVRAPEAAPFMLELMLDSRAAEVARLWLDTYVGNAVAGLIPVAAGRGRLAEAATEYLREVRRRGFTPVVEERLNQAPEGTDRVQRLVLEPGGSAYPPLDDASAPGWLRQALDAPQQPQEGPLPGWLRVESLPPLVADSRRLSDAQIRRMITGLRKSTLRKWPLVVAVRQSVGACWRDAFAWRVFETWLAAGSPARDRWAMIALGLLGADECALKLAGLIRTWPGEGQHRRAVTGLECLRAIGTDTALMQLSDIAQRATYKGVQKKAAEMLEALASARKLTRAELEDRIVPSLCFDEHGSRALDFGPRQFHVVLGPDLRPLLRDPAGKLRDDLPKPGVKDDPEKAAEALGDWRHLKKQLRAVVAAQAARLEQALVEGRRWSRAEFETFLVRHPLLSILARRLLWLGHDETGRRLFAFRLTEEGEFTDCQDRAVALAGGVAVSLAHPLLLEEPERAAWGELFADYEIVPPFPQLSRSVHRLNSDETGLSALTRFAGRGLSGPRLVSVLESRGWRRGHPGEDACVHYHCRSFPGAAITARLDYREGIPLGGIGEAGEQTLGNVAFLSGLGGNQKPLPLGQVSPLIVSEVLADLVGLLE